MNLVLTQPMLFFSDRQHSPLAAIVCCVHSETIVNLAIFFDDGNSMRDPPTSIPVVPIGAAPPESGAYCMPTQLDIDASPPTSPGDEA